MSTPISFNSRILILVLLAISLVYGNARSLSKEEYMELKAKLKVLNKPAVKSIQTEHGDIFDCVDMYKQPAFDHPLLKNHTIQMRPTSYPEGMEIPDPLNANLHIGLKDGGCPLGTVPIRRTKMQDLMRTKSLSDFGRKNVENGFQLYSASSHQTQHGDIDCVDMYKQPAFDHLLLKNHTIQMRRASYLERMENQNPSNANLESGLKDGGCPPIPRTKIQELMSAKSLSHFGRKILENRRLYSTTGHHYAIARLSSQVYGTQVTMNVWSPQLQDESQFSLAQLWLANGPHDQINTIEAGWHVNPGLYRDSVPRLFAYWTADRYTNTGCYNLLCPGFVQVSGDIALGLGSIIQPSSTYNGDQRETTFLVFKDPNTGNWWLIYENTQVGYWPKELFTSLADGASQVDWGGEVYTESTPNPQMGSGHFPVEGFKKASYMKKLMFVDNTNTLIDIPDRVILHQDLPRCYKVIDSGNFGGDWGRNIYFGGPGGC